MLKCAWCDVDFCYQHPYVKCLTWSADGIPQSHFDLFYWLGSQIRIFLHLFRLPARHSRLNAKTLPIWNNETTSKLMEIFSTSVEFSSEWMPLFASEWNIFTQIDCKLVLDECDILLVHYIHNIFGPKLVWTSNQLLHNSSIMDSKSKFESTLFSLQLINRIVVECQTQTVKNTNPPPPPICSMKKLRSWCVPQKVSISSTPPPPPMSMRWR